MIALAMLVFDIIGIIHLLTPLFTSLFGGDMTYVDSALSVGLGLGYLVVARLMQLCIILNPLAKLRFTRGEYHGD